MTSPSRTLTHCSSIMRKKFLPLHKKLKILDEAHRSNNIRGTAQTFGVQPCQIRKWRKNKAQIKISAGKGRHVCTAHAGNEAENPDLEATVYDWIYEQRGAELAVTSESIICQTLALQPSFKNADTSKLTTWVYDFFKRHNLTIRSTTHVGQQLHVDLQAIKVDFSAGV